MYIGFASQQYIWMIYHLDRFSAVVDYLTLKCQLLNLSRICIRWLRHVRQSSKRWDYKIMPPLSVWCIIYQNKLVAICLRCSQQRT